MLSRVVQLFVVAVGVAAVASLWWLPRGELLGTRPGASLVIIALAGLVGTRPVRIPSLKTELVATHPFVLCALAHFGPWAAVLAAIAGLSGAPARSGRKPSAIRLFFNLSTVVLTAVTAYWTFHALGGKVGDSLLALFPALLGATTTYFVVNTGLVTAVIALEKQQSFAEVWRGNIQWTAISFFAGLTLVAGLLLIVDFVGVWGLALGIPPSLFFVSFYRTHKDGLEEKLRRITEVETLNVELELTVQKLQVEVNERRQAEAALLESEAQLRQAQKMEAIGRLAGGIAHDFNNLLTVINGYTDLLLRKLGADDPLRVNATEIGKAGDRAAVLTRQLLAFSRRQVLAPKILDLNSVLQNMDTMLRRMVGEDVELVLRFQPDLGRVKADPGQMEQVVMNLAVNAHDAMAGGGRLMVEFANVDRGTLEANPAWKGGAYVRMKVSDTGCGMDAETASHIFEPFFTTKGEGKGTGLGLSTVYGIVKQSGGWISVESSPGVGTTFFIYLPRAEGELEAVAERPRAAAEWRGTETVLLVEDEEQVRDLAREFLEMNGYDVVETPSAQDAVTISLNHVGPIHLMLTDVVMPQMNGPELYERLAPLRPEMKVIYMSGYTDRALVESGRISGGADYLPKPFTLEALAAKVRNVLDGRSG